MAANILGDQKQRQRSHYCCDNLVAAAAVVVESVNENDIFCAAAVASNVSVKENFLVP